VRQFLNTADLEDGTDQLDTSADARRWLREHGLAARAGVMSEPDRRHLIQIREGLRSLAFANNGSPLPPAELRRLNRLTAAASITPAFTGNNQITLVATQADAVSAILAIVYESIRDGTWSRLKACRNSTCRWAFYDSSRNRAGSWCSMSACGNRAKTRAYRLRHRATP